MTDSLIEQPTVPTDREIERMREIDRLKYITRRKNVNVALKGIIYEMWMISLNAYLSKEII